MVSNGWIKLHRKIRENEMWQKDPFDKRSAWVDLLLRATHKEHTILVKGIEIRLKPGQCFVTKKGLALTWSWSRNKVANFLNILEGKNRNQRNQSLTTSEPLPQNGTSKRTPIGLVITITNWGLYQSSNSKKHTKKDSEGTPKGHRGDTYKNVKKDKNVKKNNTTDQKKKINFDFDKEVWENITIKDKDSWREAYPACDIDMEIKQMKEWLLSNPDKKKSRYRRFITNWLSRSQERGGSKERVKGGRNGSKQNRQHYQTDRSRKEDKYKDLYET